MPAHAKLFVAKRYRNARADREDGTLYVATESYELMRRTLHVQRLQFGLNAERHRDPAASRGVPPDWLLGGPHRCSAEEPGDVNHGFVNPVPLTKDAAEWLDSWQFGWSEPGHFGGNRLAAVRHRYNRRRHRYEWVHTGPPLFFPHFPAIEASPIHWRGGFCSPAAPTRTTRAPTSSAWTRGSRPLRPRPGR